MLNESVLFTELGTALVAFLAFSLLNVGFLWRHPAFAAHLAKSFKFLFEKIPELSRAEQIRNLIAQMLDVQSNVNLVFGSYRLDEASFLVLNESTDGADPRIAVCFPNPSSNQEYTADTIQSCCRHLGMSLIQYPTSVFSKRIDKYLEIASASSIVDRKLASILKNSIEISEIECGDNIEGAIELIESFGENVLAKDARPFFSVYPFIVLNSRTRPTKGIVGVLLAIASGLAAISLAASILLSVGAKVFQILPSWHVLELVIAGLALQIKTLDIALIVLVILDIAQIWTRRYWLNRQLDGRLDIGNEIARGRELIRQFFWPMLTKTIFNVGSLLIVLAVISWIRF